MLLWYYAYKFAVSICLTRAENRKNSQALFSVEGEILE